MARIRKTKKSYHRLTVEGDRKTGELILVRGGRYAYLWVGDGRDENPTNPRACVTFCGSLTLRKLAYAILAEVGK